MGKKKAKEKLHNTVMKITGLRSRVCCPECGSDEWYRHKEFVAIFRDYDDGHEELYDQDYLSTHYSCDECGCER